MVSSESNDDGKSGEIVAVWQGEGALNGPTKYDIPASPFDSLPSLSLAPNDQGNPLQHEQNVLKMSSTIISAGPLKTSLTETEMYNAVFHEQTMEPHGRQIPSSVLGASHEQLPSALPSTFASTADSEVVTSLQDSLPYVPLHSDYTIVKDSYKTTFHKTRKEKRKRREIRKLNYKDLATVGKPKNSKKWAISSAGSKVLAVAEWYFPTDGNREVMSKAAFVKSRVRKGLDVDFIPTKFNGSTTTRTSRKRKNNLATLVDEHGDRIKNSLVQDVLFDTRYLQYDNSPYGFLDQLVRPSFVTIGNPSKRSDAWGEPYLKMIPDPPICLTKTSRVGAAYQVRVCRHRDDYHDKRNASYMPEYEAIWDPVLADVAEKGGQDIEGFLGRSMRLEEREMRMKLLHSCGYNVNLALEEYHRLQVFGWEEDISWTRAETMQLDCYLQSTPIKDFTTIARKLHRSRSECLVQYYRWKSTSPAYHDLKKRWKEMNHHQGKNDYCCVCGDGGDLLVCDRCDDPYHLGCVKPSLDAIPAGDWFCSRCIPEKSSILSSPMSRTHSSSPMSKWWSQPTRVANGLVSPDKERVLPKQIVSSISGSIPKDDLISTGTKNHSGICLPVTKAPHRLKSDSSFSGPVESSRTHITGDIDNIESDASIVSEPADV